MTDLNLQEGKYYYAPHRRSWGVWKVGKQTNGVRTDQFIMDFSTKLDASRFIYKMNGYSMKRFEEEKP